MSVGRKRYIVSYDIRDAKRLRNVHKTVKSFGWPMQFSVFVCDLDAVELIILKDQIGSIINHGEDSVAIIDLGAPEHRGGQCFEFIGTQIILPTSGATII